MINDKSSMSSTKNVQKMNLQCVGQNWVLTLKTNYIKCVNRAKTLLFS